jgi:hypothetical protein
MQRVHDVAAEEERTEPSLMAVVPTAPSPEKE